MTQPLDARPPFEMTLELDTAVEDVWKALTTVEGLMAWFPLEARVTPGVGGSIFLSWGPECQGTAPITAWEPNRHLQWIETMPAPGSDKAPTVPITIDVYLEARGGKTQLRLVHSGFGMAASWDGYDDSISRGWKFELRGLRHYLRHHAGKQRHAIWVRQPTKFSPRETAQRVIGLNGQVLRGGLEQLHEGDRYRLDFVGEPGRFLEGLVQANGLPHSFSATVSNLENSYFRFEVESLGSGLEAWLWLSTWSLTQQRRDELHAFWSTSLSTALG